MQDPPAFVSPLPVTSRRRSCVFIESANCNSNLKHDGAFLYEGCARKKRCRRVRMSLSAPEARTSAAVSTVLRRWFRTVSADRVGTAAAKRIFGDDAIVEKEVCFIVALKDGRCDAEEEKILKWLFAETFQQDLLTDKSAFTAGSDLGVIVTAELGPRLSFQTAWGSNAVAVVRACGVDSVDRIETFRRYRISNTQRPFESKQVEKFEEMVHDRMTEAVYTLPIESLQVNVAPEPTREIDVLSHGESALREINSELGLGFDEQDIDYYLHFFRDDMKRNPTDVELFDLAQSNSEHSRHWFFNAKLIHDGIEAKHTLMDIVRAPLRKDIEKNNSVIAFADNSSSIRGFKTNVLRPRVPGKAGECIVASSDLDILCTAETHNFPSGVAPFPGAETGTGGRIRDSAATGIGSLVGAGFAGYSVGNLRIPGNILPWESSDAELYPSNLASPLQILIDASNGASDYGNKFGEPVIAGFARTYGLRNMKSGQRREYIKPIMFSGGMGYMDHAHARKGDAEKGLIVVKIGGPAYRIGLGGGAASSMTQGDNRSDLDFNAVQRGDAQMEQKAYRVIRACVELGQDNPIVSLHDQGAGGNCNVVKELIYPEGAKIHLRDIWIGDQSLSALEIWGAEYQEQFGLLLKPDSLQLFRDICRREGTVAAEIGVIDGSKRIVLWDSQQQRAVADMDLEKVLGKLPQKTFTDIRKETETAPFVMDNDDKDGNINNVLHRILRLMSVGSKRFLTTKVDRSVTGLVAQQQTVGPFQLPLADAGVLALSHFETHGCATALGERPTLTTLSPAAMARMSVSEMMLNLCSVSISSRADIKCEGNWMWAAKLPGDGAMLYDAAVSMKDIMMELDIALDGGKDSLSMAAKVPRQNGDMEMVRAPGTLVMTAYCTVPDIGWKLTPDIKSPGKSKLVLVDISGGKRRVGGSALAQVYGQTGDLAPDIDDVATLRNAFDVLQKLHHDGNGVLSYHDVSDGGVLVTALEMALAGNCGLDIRIDSDKLGVDTVSALFAEEAGVVLEVADDSVDSVVATIEEHGVHASILADTTKFEADSIVVYDGERGEIMRDDTMNLLSIWEKTSFLLEREQANLACVESEERSVRNRVKGLNFTCSFTPKPTPADVMKSTNKPKVAILREEGSNGDREMAAAFHMAGFEAWDVSMNDLKSGSVSLDIFRGVAFVGGFSYADVFDSAKGWAGVIKYSTKVKGELEKFYARDDTFSLGICNGCQLMALLGKLRGNSNARFIRNGSERYESRFVTVAIEKSRSMMLKDMEGSKLGVWVAHGEGRAYFPDGSDNVNEALAPLRYVDDDGRVTMEYPYNPNGSERGIAALCSEDGRHLAMMPHPERTVLRWQWPYDAPNASDGAEGIVSPWIRMFQNARAWCEEN